MNGGSYCTWTGVACVGANVVSLSLSSCMYKRDCSSGPVPASFGNLAYLRSLSIWPNTLSGTFPSSVSGLVRLEELYINNGELTSGLNYFGALPALRRMVLTNSGFNGSMPAITTPSFNELIVSNVAFTGPIPDYSALPNMTTLDVNSLSSNLSGPLPPFPASLTTLRITCGSGGGSGGANNNCALSGDLSASLQRCTALQTLFVAGTSLAGPLGSSACAVYNGLRSCSLTGNALACPLPACLAGAGLSCNPNSCSL